MADINLPVPGSDFNTWGEKLNNAVAAVNDQGEPANVRNIVSTDIDTLGSDIEGALSANYVQAGGSIANLPEITYFAHRGGSGYAPEETLEAYRVSASAGADGLEMDLQPLADGSLALLHDSTIDRTTNGTGNAADFTAPAWLTLNAAAKFPRVGPPVPPALLTQVLAEFGNQTVLLIEPKQAEDATALLDALDARGLARSVIVAASGLPVLTASKARGYTSYYGFLSNPSDTELNNAVNAGADYLGCDGSASAGLTDLQISRLVATGVPLICWGVSRRTRRDQLLGLGVNNFLSDQAIYLKRATAMRKTTSWAQGVMGHGFLSHNTSTPNVAFDTDGGILLQTDSSNVSNVLGEVSPLTDAAGTYRVVWQEAVKTLPAATSSALFLHFGGLTDNSYLNSPGYYQPGYTVHITKYGSLRCYKFTDATTYAQLGASQVTDAFVADTLITLQLDVTPTTITITRSDSGGFPPLVISDGTYRGGYLQIGKYGMGDTTAKFKNLTIT